jgi:hypothetical protein
VEYKICMNKFEFKPNIENKKTILNEWDKKILLEGSKNVVDKILKEFRGKLPDAIIYPDTSARPLSYLFDPIFSKISKEQNRKKPNIFFMKVQKADGMTMIFEDIEGRELSYDEARDHLNKYIKNFGDFGSPLADESKIFVNNLFEQTHIKRAVEQDRALEIEKHNEDLSGRGMIANLAVVDDFTNQGNTAKEINYSFGVNVPYFTIFGTKRENYVPEENMGLVIDVDNYPKNIITNSNTKLSYTVGDLRKSIGVNKTEDIDNKYVEVNKNQTPKDKEMMKTLREEMKEIGEEIANKY